MVYELVFSQRSEEDTKVAIDYYDQINPMLGERFFIELLETYQKLSVAPQYYSYISTVRKSNIRDVKLPSFPYVVIYEIRKNIVYVISVMNCYKKPLFT
jgi:hypothetical protein